jgi:hypothetical protein
MIEVKDDTGRNGLAVSVPETLKPFQTALLEQAVAVLSDFYDESSNLLCHPLNRGFKPIRESLCYAALLLVRNRAQSVTDSGLLRARKIIDAVLVRQNRNIHGASGGAFPLAWSNEKRSGIMDPDSRQIIGSLLGALLRQYSVELGRARCETIEHALRLANAGAKEQQLSCHHQSQLKAWLEMEYGDRLNGEELLVELTDQSSAHQALARFGQPQAFGYELWANALWLSSQRLGDWGKRQLREVLQDVGESLHPAMHQLLGSGLASRMHTEGGAEWINVWLTWLAMGSNPMLPRDMNNPLDATLFALPALGGVSEEIAADAWSSQWDQDKRALSRVIDDRRITASFEAGLHIEACSTTSIAAGSEPAVAAFWQCDSGVARLSCQATASHLAVCDGRSVKLETPGKCRIVIDGIGPGGTRLIEDGWQLPGLRLTCRGFEIGDAERSADGLNMSLRPLRDHGLLVFSPIS